jgi:pyruvate kinase
MPRATKIVATLGPSHPATPDILEAMIRAGVNVVRLNFSHGSSAGSHTDRADMVRAAAQRAGTVVAIMADLQGPKIRVGKFAQRQGACLKTVLPFVLDAARTEPGDERRCGPGLQRIATRREARRCLAAERRADRAEG